MNARVKKRAARRRRVDPQWGQKAARLARDGPHPVRDVDPLRDDWKVPLDEVSDARLHTGAQQLLGRDPLADLSLLELTIGVLWLVRRRGLPQPTIRSVARLLHVSQATVRRIENRLQFAWQIEDVTG